MWLLAINPTSGQGKGARVGQEVSNYLANRNIHYRLVTGANALALQENIRQQASAASGIIAVGGDGLIHMCIQLALQFQLPLVPIPAGTGNDFVRALGWKLAWCKSKEHTYCNRQDEITESYAHCKERCRCKKEIKSSALFVLLS